MFTGFFICIFLYRFWFGLLWLCNLLRLDLKNDSFHVLIIATFIVSDITIHAVVTFSHFQRVYNYFAAVNIWTLQHAVENSCARQGLEQGRLERADHLKSLEEKRSAFQLKRRIL